MESAKHDKSWDRHFSSSEICLKKYNAISFYFSCVETNTITKCLKKISNQMKSAVEHVLLISGLQTWAVAAIKYLTHTRTRMTR